MRGWEKSREKRVSESSQNLEGEKSHRFPRGQVQGTGKVTFGCVDLQVIGDLW